MIYFLFTNSYNEVIDNEKKNEKHTFFIKQRKDNCHEKST